VKVSIVTPSFNQALYLDETLRSVLDQGYPELEYVVVDAGSSDGSVDIIRSYEERLAFWVSEPDGGHADGLNKGFAHTTGEIMAWINTSDIYYPWTLRIVAQVFHDVPEVEWATGIPSHVCDGPGPANPVDISIGGWNEYDVLSGKGGWIQQESVFWRRSLWERSGPLDPDYHYACDFELWSRFLRCAPLYHVPTVLGGFRFHEDRRGSTSADQYRVEADQALERFAAGFSQRDMRRARLVGVVGRVGRGVLCRGLARAGLWPWYSHPTVRYDHERRRWIVA
jgi:glycosyltransferase involved in cell wall biosynthesis